MADEIAPQPHRIGNVAVMRDREAAGGEIGIERLDVPERGLAGGRIADMAARDAAGERANHLVAVEIAGNVPHRAVRMEMRAVEAGDAGGLLPAVLQRMQPERDQRGGAALTAGNTENAALLVQLVVIERIRGQHLGPIWSVCVPAI